MQKIFYNTDPGDFASIIIKTGDDGTKERLRVREAPGESLGVLCFGSLEILQERSEPRLGCFQLTGQSQKGDLRGMSRE